MSASNPVTPSTSDIVKSPDDIISEKSERIKEWVKQRLEKDSFEFPRGRAKPQPTEPEVMHFKATQKLFNPNSTAKTSVAKPIRLDPNDPSTKQHYRHLLLAFYNQNPQITGKEMVKKIKELYGKNAINERTCRRWKNKFENGEKDVTNLNDNNRSGRPQELDDELLRQAIADDPSATIDMLVERMGFSHGTVYNHLHRIGLLENQNQRLREQNRRCTNQLKALTTCAEKNKNWQKSLLSQSVTGVLPFHSFDMHDPNRTSDDSGLTSDETSGERSNQQRFPPTSLSIYSHHHQQQQSPGTSSGGESSSSSNNSSGVENLTTTAATTMGKTNLMTQSTSAILMKRSPRQQPRRPNGFPKTTLKDYRNPSSNGTGIQDSWLPPTTTASERENQSPSTTDSSPWDEKPKAPIPAPRKKHSDGGPVVLRKIERDSLNSYAGEDDYGEYEEDEDEIFDEIIDESPAAVSRARADYVNLSDFCVVKDSAHVYSDIVKVVPEIPKHQPLIQFEQKLFRTAEKCLSIIEDNPSTSGEPSFQFLSTKFSRTSDNSRRHPCSSAGSIPSRESNPDSGLGRCSSERVPSNGLPEKLPDCMVLTHPPREDSIAAATSSCSRLSTTSDYAIPPHEESSRFGTMRTPRRDHESNIGLSPLALRASIVLQTDAEMNGYLSAMSDSRLKSLKRRYVVLKNSEMKFYRTQKHLVRDENPTMTIKLRDVKNVTKVSSKSGGNGFEIMLNGESHKLQAEADKVTDEWYNTLTQQLKTLTITDLSQRSLPFDPQISGWVTKVKNGHQKRYFTQIIDDKLVFFKKPDEKIPHSHQNLRGARISEKSKSSSDEYSSSSGDEQNEIGAIRGSANCSSSASAIYNGCGDSDYSICIEAVDSDPQYLILRSSEDKDRWLYYLKLAARDASIRGTSFEILIERLMADPNPLDSLLWEDLLFKTVEEHQTETITTIDNPELKKMALEIDLACYLFTAVQMRPIAIQYHVDLSQNVLTKALQHEALQNEIYAQLIRLTSGSMEFGYQAWKLLSMAIPLYLPKQYSLLWLLRHHIERTRKAGIGTEAQMAEYCNQALSNRQKVGDRLEGPSKLEAVSILTRDPMTHVLPYSIAIRLPTGDYQVIEFDGSTEIGQCLSSLCLKLGIRPALLSGYALYANDPMGSVNDLILLKGKQKLCDCLTLWERQMKDSKTGRVTADACAIKLQLRLRNYWASLADEETPTERLFLCQRLAEEVVAGHLPLSNDLAEELCALYAQMCYGDASDSMDDKLIDEILARFYPAKLLEVANRRSLRSNVLQQWKTLLKGVNVTECVRLILIVLRKWKFFGSYVKEARQKIDGKRIFIAINENGIHLLSNQLELLKSFRFHRLINFGEYHNDFMITVSRVLQPNSHPDESNRERLTFNMEKKAIEQLTTHLAEYIRCQKLLWKISRK